MSAVPTLLGRCKKLFEMDARAWGLRRHQARWIALLPLLLVGTVAVLAVLAVAAKTSFRPVFRFVVSEDSVLEWLQFSFVFVSSMLFARLAIHLLRLQQYGYAALYAMLALATFFVAGEEISWGQRVFGWGTPEALDAINHQGETNVHNIRIVQRLFGFGVMFGSMYGVVAPLARALFPSRIRVANLMTLLVPPLALVPAFLMPFSYRLFRLVVWPDTDYIVVKSGEAPEVCLYFGLFLFGWLSLRRLRQEYPVVEGNPARVSS